MCEYSRYPRGSEWRKWDLHIHSPLSILNNQFSRLENGEPNWELFLQKLESLDIAVLGITDYFTIEGYKIIKKFKEQGRLPNIDTILPNIEFRLKNIVSSRNGEEKRLNLHVIISDEVPVDDIEEHFLHDIHFSYEGDPQNRDERRKLKITNLESLGQSLIEQHANFSKSCSSPLEVGAMQAVVDHQEITDLLTNDSRFFGKYVIVLSAGDWDKINWDGQAHSLRKLLLQKSDMVFTSNYKTRKWCLGMDPYAEGPEHFIREFKSLKPCIHGSDAHRLEDIGTPCAKRGESGHNCEAQPSDCELRYCWIKANPTYEGLKQVLYEPSERVKIQNEPPSVKTPYLVINKVRFIDNSKKKRFQQDSILLNEGLNVIIGGKSSGKSLLLHHIAKTIDASQVNEILSVMPSPEYEFEDDSSFDFEVQWNDGEILKLRQKSSEHSRRVTYIPQMYINYLAEKRGDKQLKVLIEDLLFQNHEYSDFYQEIRTMIREKNSEISNCINTLFLLRESYAELQREMKEVGDQKAISAHIKEIQREIDKLRRSSGFNEGESKIFEELRLKKDNNEKKLEKYTEIYNVLSSFCVKTTDNLGNAVKRHLIEAEEESVENTIDTRIQDILVKCLKKRKDDILDKLLEEYKEIDKVLLASIEKRLVKYNSTISMLQNKLEPYLAKIKNQEYLKRLMEQVRKEDTKLSTINEKRKLQKDIKEKGVQQKEILRQAYLELMEAYKSIVSKLSTPPFNMISNDLNLNVTLDFDSDQFDNSFTTMFDRRSNLSQELGDCFQNNHFVYNDNNHRDNIAKISEIISKIDNTSLRILGDYKPRDAIFRLFDDYFVLRYSISHNGENILRMSPGQRGLVLLQLILHLSNMDHPILIDQPEDNLDNRTIFNELSEFIIKRKHMRQIIFVTHNANITVATDSENVIVANQSGQDNGNKNREHQFEYVTGALEHTFRNNDASGILYQMGIREHVCDILEGGLDAFKKREKKYGFK